MIFPIAAITLLIVTTAQLTRLATRVTQVAPRHVAAAAAILGSWFTAVILHGNTTTSGAATGWVLLTAGYWLSWRLHLDATPPTGTARTRAHARALARARTRRRRLATWLGAGTRRHP